MKKGYYTNQSGQVLGYFELSEMPVGEEHIWVEADTLPPLYVAPKTSAERIKEIDEALSVIDAKSIRALREGNPTRINELEGQAVVLRNERATLI